jgi:hypothetical protein
MATIVTRSGKGSPLTNTEVDSNFTNLNTDKIEDAPSDGTTYARQSGAWAAVTAAAATITTSSTAPSSPSDGDVWYSESNGVTYVYYDDGTSSQWVATGAPTGSLGGASNLTDLDDVSITSPQDQDILVYDGTSSSPTYQQWTNRATVIEQWDSGTVSFSSSHDAVVTSGWTRSSNHINGNMSESSGVFTFTQTGTWLVRADFNFYGTNGTSRTASPLTLGASLEQSTDGGTSYSNVTGNSFADRRSYAGKAANEVWGGSGTISIIVIVSNLTANRVRVRAKAGSSATSNDKLDVQLTFQLVRGD